MFSVGGGGCGIAQGIGDPPHMIAGASGESATGSSIVRSWYNQPGMAGSVGENMVAAGGASVFYGYGAGGGNAAAGGAGVFQITINQ